MEINMKSMTRQQGGTVEHEAGVIVGSITADQLTAEPFLVHVPDEALKEMPYLSITLSCGERRDYQTKDDVPRETVECTCGKVPHPHFFIEYSDGFSG